MRRSAERQCFEQMAEPQLSLFAVDSEQFEHLRLDVGGVDTNAAAADLDAVENNIVRLCTDTTRIGFKPVDVRCNRARERMMHRRIVAGFLIVLEQREFVDPEKVVFVFGDKPGSSCDIETQPAKGIADDGRLVGNDQDNVARLSFAGSDDLIELFIGKKLGDRRLALTAAVDLDRRQPLGFEEFWRCQSIHRSSCAKRIPPSLWR